MYIYIYYVYIYSIVVIIIYEALDVGVDAMGDSKAVDPEPLKVASSQAELEGTKPAELRPNFL